MGVKETVQQVMNGRSEQVERGIDTAVKGFSSFLQSLSQRAEDAKAKARDLDPARRGGAADTAGAATSPAGAAPDTSTVPAATTTPAPPAGGPGLRGHLVTPIDPDPA